MTFVDRFVQKEVEFWESVLKYSKKAHKKNKAKRMILFYNYVKEIAEVEVGETSEFDDINDKINSTLF